MGSWFRLAVVAAEPVAVGPPDPPCHLQRRGKGFLRFILIYDVVDVSDPLLPGVGSSSTSMGTTFFTVNT
jgi:hypothetical protein